MAASRDRRVIVAAAEPWSASPRASASSNSGAQVAPVGAMPREPRIGGLQRALGRPPAVGHDREPLVARCDWRTPGALATASREKPVRRPPGGAIRTEANSMSGQAHVAGEAQAAVGLGRAVEPRQRLADQRALPIGAARVGSAACGSAASSASSPKVKVRPPLMTNPSAVSHSLGLDVPTVGRRADQHRARDRRGLAQRLLERADRGRAGGDPHRPRAGAMPSSHLRPAGWHRPPPAAPARPPTVSHAAPSSSATICGSAVQMPCPVSTCGTATVTRPSRRDLDEIAERLLAAPHREIAGEAAAARREGDDQPDADAAADQQRPAVDRSVSTRRTAP